MCEPVTIAVATSLAVAGAATSAYSQFKQAQYQQAMAQRGRQTSAIAAADALARGQAAAGRINMRASDISGAQRVTAAASGVDIGSGSPMRVQQDTALRSAIDVETAKTNAAKEAWGFEVEGQNYGMKADQAGQAADWDLLGGTLSTTGSALGGAAKTWRSYKLSR
jgi:hypothetical protein